jgi:hypothetical protein
VSKTWDGFRTAWSTSRHAGRELTIDVRLSARWTTMLLSLTLRRCGTRGLEGSNCRRATKTSEECLLTCIRVGIGPLVFAQSAKIGWEDAEGVEVGLDNLVACYSGCLSLISLLNNVLLGKSILLTAPSVSRGRCLRLRAALAFGWTISSLGWAVRTLVWTVCKHLDCVVVSTSPY